MKTAFLIAMVIANGLFLSAQPAAAQPAQGPSKPQAPYLANPTIPPFHLLETDSATYLTKNDLKKNWRTIIMFFSPDCEHCKHQTEALLDSLDQLGNVQIVMATYQPFGEMKEFNTHYRLFEHPNFKVGRDEKFFLAPFYRIHNFPYLALYDKKGKLITTFEGTHSIAVLKKAFQHAG
jgi:cytochrome oxidase Cu insertion factor (SCO1/SenC/PrrC family)